MANVRQQRHAKGAGAKLRCFKAALKLSTTSAWMLAIFLLLQTFTHTSIIPLVEGISSSEFGFGLCINQLQACQADDICKSCLYNQETADAEVAADCMMAYSDEATTSMTSDSCAAKGANACCAFQDDIAIPCMSNELVVDYWTCILAGDGCTIEDMPCSSLIEASATSAPSEVSDGSEEAVDVEDGSEEAVDAEDAADDASSAQFRTVGVVGPFVTTLVALAAGCVLPQL